MMPRISECLICECEIENMPRGRLREYCDAHDKAWRMHQWFIEKRQKNPKWRAENKRRAKAWRKKKQDHIHQYNVETGRIKGLYRRQIAA